MAKSLTDLYSMDDIFLNGHECDTLKNVGLLLENLIMNTLQNIEQDIQSLPVDDVFALHQWLDNYKASLWDKQIERDSKNGKLDDLMNQARKDFKEGKCKKI